MQFSSLLEACRHAQAHSYAVPAINVVDELSMRAVASASEQAKSPIIIQISVKTLQQWGLAEITSCALLIQDQIQVPFVLHLDHCPDIDIAKSVIKAGWSSVLMDVSSYDDAKARALLTELAHFAHLRGATIEAEIENILGVEDGVGSDKVLRSCSVAELVEIMTQTEADLLAPQLGTAHGEYKSEPVLQPQRAREITSIAKFPVVLHGGTGLTAEDFGSFIDAGVSKINISTALKHAYAKSALDHFETTQGSRRWDPLVIQQAQRSAIIQMTAEHIEIFRSGGRIDV